MDISHSRGHPEGVPRSQKKSDQSVTEHQRTLEQLQAQKDLLDLAQKAARAMAFEWYIQKELNTWSPQQEELYGLEPGAFDGTYESWRKLVHPNDWPVVVQALRHWSDREALGEIPAPTLFWGLFSRRTSPEGLLEPASATRA